jgi:ribonuclease BN (tRNA processing enzyme)
MIKRNGKFVWEDIEFHIVQSVHIMDEYAIVPSFGLMMIDPRTKKKIYYTGDTQFNPNQIMDFYKEADLIIQDCETTPYKSGVHANFLDLITLDDDIKGKMILQHYQDNVLDQEDKKITQSWNASAEGAGFTSWDEQNHGFVLKGFILDTQRIFSS